MKMNSLMASHWGRIAKISSSAVLHPALSRLAQSPFVEVKGAVVLEELFNPARDEPTEEDLTGFEMEVNKIHVEDFTGEEICQDVRLVQGMKYAETLVARLAAKGQPFRFILSRDPDSDAVVARFCVRRPGQRWNSDDLEGCTLEELAQWDT